MDKAQRRSSKTLDTLVLVVSVAIFLFLAAYGYLLWESPSRLILIFVPSVLVLWVLRRLKAGKRLLPVEGPSNAIAAVVLIAMLAFIGYYLYTEYYSLLAERSANNNALDFAVGAVIVVTIVIVTWIETGRAIPIVFFVFTAYAFLGRFLPVDNFFYSPGISWREFLQFTAIGPDGMLGSLTVTGFTLIIVFLYFAGMVQEAGGLNYVINASSRLTRRFSWGLPQIPVIASLIFGTFSGSAAANAAGTGSFTIPMMKKFGVPPKLAAAIEAVASTGGQVMPPVMGVAAFLMADFLNVTYIQVVAWGAAPGLILYITCAFAVYWSTKTLGIGRLSAEQRKQGLGEYRAADGLLIGIPVLLLLFWLIYFRSSVLIAGMWMIISFVALRLVFALVRGRGSWLAVKNDFLIPTVKGIQSGSTSTVQMFCMFCVMSAVAKMLIVTNLTQRVSFLMVDLSQGNLWLLLALVLVVAYFFGMAVSTAIVYIVVVLLAAPSLVAAGVQPHVAHYAVFYMAMISAITPPVAIAVAVTSTIAGAPYFATGWRACRIATPLLLLPLVFIVKPDLLAANLGTTPIAFVEVLVSFLAMAYALNGTMPHLKGYSIRSIFFVLGAVTLFSNIDLVIWGGLAAILALAAFLYLTGRRASVPAAQ